MASDVPRRPSIRQRLEELYRRLTALPRADSSEQALEQLCQTLDEVEHGFAVDEAGADDGFTLGYRYSSADFPSASEHLRRLVVKEVNDHDNKKGIGLGLLVLYSSNIEECRQFYSLLGLSFASEQHGSGPVHYSARLGTTVFEIYPCTKDRPAATTRIGFRLPSVESALVHLRRE